MSKCPNFIQRQWTSKFPKVWSSEQMPKSVFWCFLHHGSATPLVPTLSHKNFMAGDLNESQPTSHLYISKGIKRESPSILGYPNSSKDCSKSHYHLQTIYFEYSKMAWSAPVETVYFKAPTSSLSWTSDFLNGFGKLCRHDCFLAASSWSGPPDPHPMRLGFWFYWIYWSLARA